MDPYVQGFLDKCAEDGITAKDVAKFVLPVAGATALGAAIGAPIGAVKKDYTMREGAIDWAAMLGAASLAKQIVKRLNLGKRLMRDGEI